MRQTILAAAAATVVALCAGPCPAAVPLTEDPPPVPAPRSGNVTGRITNPAKVAKLSAVSRVTHATYQPTSFNHATGEFVFAHLPGDARYDVCIQTTDGRTIEGIDLDFVDQRMLRLAALRRKELGLPPERTHKFTRDDVDAILKHIAALQDFMELRRVLYIRGQGRRATVLLELMRTRAHYNGHGRYVWRVELWYFKDDFGGWDRVANQARVLRRERIDPADWAKIDLSYYAKLSAHVDPNGYSKPIRFTIPDKTDPTRGRPAHTEPTLAAHPHILGLDQPPSTTSKP